MGDDQTKVLSLKAAYDFGAANGLAKEVAEIRDMEIEWDRSYTSTLRRGRIVALFRAKGLFETFKNSHWRHGDTPFGESEVRKYLRVSALYDEFLAGRDSGSGPLLETDPELAGIAEEQADHQFAYESDLRDFLARNPERIEPGLRVHEADGKSGVEYAIEDGRIDLLAVDRNGKYVVIELKVGRGRNRTIGQLLYYMGWIDKHLGNGPCRGMIIAKDISDDLVLACRRAEDVSLRRYKMSVSVNRPRAAGAAQAAAGPQLAAEIRSPIPAQAHHRDTLDKGLPRAYTPELYQQKCSAVFEHVYESYPERDTGVYATAQ